MLKRKKHLIRYNLRYLTFKKTKLQEKILNSFFQAQTQQPVIRISHKILADHKTSQHFFFKSQDKLQCKYSYNFSVPSKKINLSRFYFIGSANALILGRLQKA